MLIRGQGEVFVPSTPLRSDIVSGSGELSAVQGQPVLPDGGGGSSAREGQLLIDLLEQRFVINLREDFQFPTDGGVDDFPS